MKTIKLLSVSAILFSSMTTFATPMLTQALQQKEVVAVTEDKDISEVTATQLNDTVVRITFSGNIGVNGSKVSFCKFVDFVDGNVKSVSSDTDCN